MSAMACWGFDKDEVKEVEESDPSRSEGNMLFYNRTLNNFKVPVGYVREIARPELASISDAWISHPTKSQTYLSNEVFK